MKIQELEEFLEHFTDSENRHMLTEKHILSGRYRAIPQIPFRGRDLYQFTFNSLLENKNVCVNKESRFTYIPEHIHTVIEFLYVYAGSCTQVINGEKIRMKQGDICMLDTDVPHSIEYLTREDIIITIEMRKEYLTQGFLSRLGDNGIINHFLINTLSLNAAHDQYLLFEKQTESQVHALIQNILCEHYDPAICSEKMIDAYIILLFCEILRQYQDRRYSAKPKDNRQIMEILDYIEQHCLEATLQGTADHFGFHPNYLSSYIKKKTGESFKELIIRQRMYQASFYLTNTTMPVYEIADKVGYHNLGFFYHKFTEIYKTTPALYRELKA